ncbi:MAG TPA: ATPase domain-containing protein [Pyrinomonadaceae bacterium]|nr:ATPase domain-containing protein [Pyrinomonadaceae bacterium]
MDKTETVNSDRVSTGIEGLDFILKGGLPKNRLYLLQGSPGTGKTTLGLQFLLDGEQKGETSLYITLSESKEELIAVGESHNWNLDKLNIFDLTISGESLRDDSRYTVFHPSEVELDETTQAILNEVERINPSRVVFDSLSEMRMLASESLRFRRQILALKQYFIGRQCTVLLLDDLTSDYADRQLESIAHGVVTLEYVPTEYGKQRHNLRVVKMRGVNFQSGSHDFNIETGGIVVFPRLGSPEVKQKFQPGVIQSDMHDLEQLLGGLDYGTSTIFTGPAGIGKSTMALMYACTAAASGERAAIYLFDEAPETLYKRTAALGLEVEKYVEERLINIRQIKLAELTPGELGHMISQEIEKNNTRMVIIDSVNGYLMSTPQERFLMMQFHELLAYLNRRGIVSILIVGQYGLIGNMRSPIDMSYLADTVVLLRYFEAAGAVRQAISVLKKRTGKHERTIREFRIDKGGIRLGQPLTEFHGVLTGVPVFHGEAENLMEKNGERDGK